MTEQEINVITAAMDLAEDQHAVDCGLPAQSKVKRALETLIDRCADLAAENDGRWRAPEPD